MSIFCCTHLCLLHLSILSLVHPFPPFLNRIFSMRTCVAALPEHSCSAHIHSMCVLFSGRTIFGQTIVYMYLCSAPPCRYLSCSGCLAFYFVYPFLPSYQVFFLILLPLLSISFLSPFLLRCTCRKLIDAPLYDRGLSYSLCIRKCHCFLAKLLPSRAELWSSDLLPCVCAYWIFYKQFSGWLAFYCLKVVRQVVRQVVRWVS